MLKQDSEDVRSPSPCKANLEHIKDLLDEDDDCFCLENINQLALTRQKSKTDYSKRAALTRKESLVSAIQEAEPGAENGSLTNSQSFKQNMNQCECAQSPCLKVSDGGGQLARPSPAQMHSHVTE